MLAGDGGERSGGLWEEGARRSSASPFPPLTAIPLALGLSALDLLLDRSMGVMLSLARALPPGPEASPPDASLGISPGSKYVPVVSISARSKCPFKMSKCSSMATSRQGRSSSVMTWVTNNPWDSARASLQATQHCRIRQTTGRGWGRPKGRAAWRRTFRCGLCVLFRVCALVCALDCVRWFVNRERDKGGWNRLRGNP